LMSVLAIFGIGSPVQNVQANSQDNDTTFVMAVDAQSLVRLLAML
jgi:hypothetical protein